jgi:hypothetical protein
VARSEYRYGSAAGAGAGAVREGEGETVDGVRLAVSKPNTIAPAGRGPDDCAARAAAAAADEGFELLRHEEAGLGFGGSQMFQV